jgi:pSer/pThr/pTyr-binding forkhead associated (FHA) protein
MTLRLRIVQGRPHGQQLCFPQGEYLFGRGAECQVRPNSEWVSRQHCLLRVTADAAWIRDLGSRNGTLLNGVRLVSEHGLCSGDRVEIGPLVFEVQLDPAPAGSDPSGDTLCRAPMWADTIALSRQAVAALPDTPTPPAGVRADTP